MLFRSRDSPFLEHLHTVVPSDKSNGNKMKSHATLAAVVSGLIAGSQACDSCFGPVNKVEHVRQVKRMQPDAFNATYGPTRGSLEWGQLNFLHTVSCLLTTKRNAYL